MVIIENGFYIIDDKYFTDFEDPFLRGNPTQPDVLKIEEQLKLKTR